ncbi:hypothetical protein SLS56_008980 [Neofusicoccum ribis]|uniref:AAA+ ATPase domain-containing protein n=1 Tax=Neofusicoccum ribis TaxID=45134 RepID=A0ABR3SJ69_9PEZI
MKISRLRNKFLADADDSTSESSSGYSSGRHSVASRSDRAQLSRIKIISPAVAEAIRHVVNYRYPDDLRSKNPILFEPYEVLFHHEKALEEYQQTFSPEHFGEPLPECMNQYAFKHIGILLDFVRGKFGAKVAAERERHARGVATYDMLWLLLELGSDVYIQPNEIGVLEPRVLDELDWVYSQDEPPPRYQANTWKLGAGSDSIFADFPHDTVYIRPFAGERHIDTLPVFPCRCLRKDAEGRNAEEARRYFEKRGQKFFQLRRKGCHSFNGFSAEFPRQPVIGFHPAKFDSNLMNELVLEGGTKEVIKQLTKNYMRRLLPSEEKVAGHMNSQSALGGNDMDDFTAWSADFIEGKGRGLIFLLHGTPGVGKTYTAECIAANTRRPLLSLTCADLGTDPMKIETKLIRWFNIAKSWGAILLIDEADIYMEQREVQDLKRNNLVAGFLRAMEYYQGILFLTTNRVGTFDEAFVSRINVMIHYPPFTDKQRIEVWESFFSKLERERETTMRVALSTRDFVREDKKLQMLEWNGREIRNGNAAGSMQDFSKLMCH